MIKLDRRRKRKPKNEDEEEQERTEVNFSQDVRGEKLTQETQRGGLEIRRKSTGEAVEDETKKEEKKDEVRKGPAMPPPEVLAALAASQAAETPVETPEEKSQEKSEEKIKSPEPPKVQQPEPISKEPPSKDEFKVPMKAPEFIKPPALPTCDNPGGGKLPSEIYKQPKTESKKPEEPKLSYRPPAWSGECSDDTYKLEVLKGGKIIGAYKLAGKATHVLGKLESCDLRLEHPSISRHHAILQWHVVDSTWKLLDYGSTHGVKINKMKLRPHQYVRCCVGSVVEFGLSTRKYIMVGPEADQLEETKESGFELREKFKKQQRKLEKQMLGESDSDEENDKKDEEGVSWGFTEDAWDDDNDFGEIDTDKKPEFLKTTLNPDAFYHRDPLKAINHFFTSDAQEPPWALTQTPKGRWECKLELPIGDGAAGVVVSGEADGKIGAKTVCALEACLALDRHGMFDEHAKARKKRSKLEENDFYDSDEDEFFDRTGELNSKREKRRKAAGLKKNKKEAALTHGQIMEKVAELTKQIESLEAKMAKDKQMRAITKAAEDPLDAFMKQVKQGHALDSMTRSKMHREKAELAKELNKYSKLAALAAPAKLADQFESAEEKKKAQQKLLNRMKTGKRGFGMVKRPTLAKEAPKVTESVVEHDSDDEESKQAPKVVKLFDKESKPVTKPTAPKPTAPPPPTPTPQPKSPQQKKPEVQRSTPPPAKKSRIQATIIPGMLKDDFKEEYAVKAGDDEESEKKSREQRKNDAKSNTKAMKNFDATYEESAEYSTWVPPSNQSGDGTTALNKKLGY